MNQLKRSQGFAMSELMVSIFIASLMMYALFTILRTSTEMTQGEGVKMTIEDSAREGLYKMLQEIRLSAPSQVTILNSGDSIQFKIPDTADPLGSDYRVDWDAAHTVTYALGGDDNNQIIRTNEDGQTQVVANDVTSINFTGDASPPNEITVSINVQRSMTNERQVTATPLQLIGKADLRNP